MTGNEVKSMIHNSGVKLWEVASVLGMNDGNFSRRLRKPFSPSEVERIIEITNNLAAQRDASRTETTPPQIAVLENMEED